MLGLAKPYLVIYFYFPVGTDSPIYWKMHWASLVSGILKLNQYKTLSLYGWY